MFKPKINKKKVSSTFEERRRDSELKYYDRYDSPKKSNNKVYSPIKTRRSNTTSKNQKEEVLFKPKINPKSRSISARLYKDKDIVEELYNHKKKVKKVEKDKKYFLYYNSLTFKPFVTYKSAKYASDHKVYFFIFRNDLKNLYKNIMKKEKK